MFPSLLRRFLPLFGLACIAVEVPAGPVNINSADATTLARELKGIGLKRAQAIVTLQARRVAVQDHVRVVGVEERVVVLALVEAGKGARRQRPDVVVAHRRYMSWPPLTAQTWPVM